MNQDKKNYFEQLLRESSESCSLALDAIKSEESFSQEEKVNFLKSISDKMNLEKIAMIAKLNLMKKISRMPDIQLQNQLSIDLLRIEFNEKAGLSLMIDNSILVNY
jgi:hypothetical protein